MHLESCTGVTISRRNRKGATVSLLLAAIAGRSDRCAARGDLDSEGVLSIADAVRMQLALFVRSLPSRRHFRKLAHLAVAQFPSEVIRQDARHHGL